MDEAKKDFLTQVLNVGLGQAGTALGEMTGTRIELTVPDIAICKITELDGRLSTFGQGDVYSVTLRFSGILSGDAILVLTGMGAKVLTYRLCDDELDTDDIESEIEEVVTEVGNIINNHFIGAWAATFADQFKFDVPVFEHNPLSTILERYKNHDWKGPEEPQAVFAEAHMDIPDFFMVASIVIMFEQESLERLVGSVSESSSR